MTATRMGLFTLIDPPTPDHAEVVREGYEAIDFPWQRMIPELRKRGHPHITVRWGPAGGNLGVWLAGSSTIELTDRYGPNGQDFIFCHEAGHAVDSLTLTWEQQTKIKTLFHSCQSRWTGQDNGVGTMHEMDHNQPHPEGWSGVGGSYRFRHLESFAEAFVATFASHIWGPYRDMDPRFVHWPINYTNGNPDGIHYDELRRITLEEPIMAFTDVPADHPHREGIEWAAVNGLVKGQPDGRFEPEKPLNRGQLCTILHRQATK